MKKLVLALILAAFIAPSAFAATGTATFTVNVTQFAAIENLGGGEKTVTGEAAYLDTGDFLFTEDFNVTANDDYNLTVTCGNFGAILATTCTGSATAQPAAVSAPQTLTVGGEATSATLAGQYASEVVVTVSMN